MSDLSTTSLVQRAVQHIPSAATFWSYLTGTTVVLIGMENYFRRNQADSMLRPSIFLSYLADKGNDLFTFLGYQLARVTDLYYLIKEYLAEDLRNIICSGWDVVVTPLKMLKGYHDYYTGSMTPLSYGILSTTLVILGVIGGWRYMNFGAPYGFSYILSRFRGLDHIHTE